MDLNKTLCGTTALSAIALALLGTPAWAQDRQSDQRRQASANEPQATERDQEIVVTGSILRRTDSETPSPVTVLSSESLERRGINTVAEAVQRISANGAGTMTQGWNTTSNFATGANAVSLRGLTVQSTLSIVDGLRMAPYPLADDGHRNFVDLNTIPESTVDRIEVLKDGASSTYGADAIAGVVNVILKKQITGIQGNASAGVSSRGDAAEKRVDLAIGYGKLSEQGFNVYLAGEYQKQDMLFARDRGHPIGTDDLSKICRPGNQRECMSNGVQFGINADGTLSTGTITSAALVAPLNAANTRTGEYRLLNTALGCNVSPGLRSITLTNPQRAPNAAGTAFTWAANQCQQDLREQYEILQPKQERYGFVFRATANIGSNAQAYATASFYNVHSIAQAGPSPFLGQTPPPSQVLLNPLVLPVYVCPGAVATFENDSNVSTGCNAANGMLNPNNPFAALGQTAVLRARYDRPYTVESNARSLRAAFGISGNFGDDWTYSADFAISNVKLDILTRNMLIPQRVADVVARGTYDFRQQSLNGEAIRNYIAPTNTNVSNSDLWQAQATIGKKLIELPGGPLQAAVGIAYRHESIDNPSANPDNPARPYDRYYTINAVGAIGARNVKSAFFEVGAPIADFLEVNASGRYDSYSSGQKNFSPKIGAKFTPLRQLAIRGTWSRGFRIPSFNEAFGLPTTGYNSASIDCSSATYRAFCAAHTRPGAPGPNSYAAGNYSIGMTNVGNPALKPERSRSITAGVVFEPIRNLSFTADYWNIRVKDLISGIPSDSIAAAINQYYTNNGVVTVPGVTAIRGAPDVEFPSALPVLGFLQSSYQNADSQEVSGIDLGANARFQLGAVTWTSSLDASYLMKHEFTSGGRTVRYDGTLSPCDVTSCSGAPKWRGSWENTLTFGDFDLTGTLYYTSPMNLWAVDYGENGCTVLNGQGIKGYKVPAGSPPGTRPVAVQCRSRPVWNFDLGGRVRVGDRFTFYVNVMNVFDIKPPLDVSAAYGDTRYNPAWAQPNAIGRFFRVGAKVNF